jgi:hypothetical protein
LIAERGRARAGNLRHLSLPKILSSLGLAM